MPVYQVGRQIRQAVNSVFSPTIFDRYTLALYVAALLQTSTEAAQPISHCFNRTGIDKSYDRQRSQLSLGGKRPCRRTANERDELAPPHSMTSSARAIRHSGPGPTSRRLC